MWQIRNENTGTIPLVLIPGWGFTGEIVVGHPAFCEETLITNSEMTNSEMVESLIDFLAAHHIAEVRVLGWSMGGNLAIDLLIQKPELVSCLTLVAVRQQWPSPEVEATRGGLLASNGQGLAKFHRKCFAGQKAEYTRLASRLGDITAGMDTALLGRGLDYLASYSMPASLSQSVHIIQGDRDLICPAAEMVRFHSESNITLLGGAGHFPFSHPEFTL